MSYNFTCNHLVFMFLIRINYRESLLLKWWKDTSFISIHLIPKCLGFQVYLSFQWLMIPGPWDLACCWSQAKGVDRPCFCSKQIRWSKKKIAITFSLHFFYWFIKYSFSLNLFYKCQIFCSIFLALNIICIYVTKSCLRYCTGARGWEWGKMVGSSGVRSEEWWFFKGSGISSRKKYFKLDSWPLEVDFTLSLSNWFSLGRIKKFLLKNKIF